MAFTATVTEAPAPRSAPSAARMRQPVALPFTVPVDEPVPVRPVVASVPSVVGPAAREGRTDFLPLLLGQPGSADTGSASAAGLPAEITSNGAERQSPAPVAPSVGGPNADARTTPAAHASKAVDAASAPLADAAPSMQSSPTAGIASGAPEPPASASGKAPEEMAMMGRSIPSATSPIPTGLPGSGEERPRTEDAAPEPAATPSPVPGQPVLVPQAPGPQPAAESPGRQSVERPKAVDASPVPQAIITAIAVAAPNAAKAKTSGVESGAPEGSDPAEVTDGAAKAAQDDAMPGSGNAALAGLLSPIPMDGLPAQTVPQAAPGQSTATSPLGSNPIVAVTGERSPATALSAPRGASRPVQAEAVPDTTLLDDSATGGGAAALIDLPPPIPTDGPAAQAVPQGVPGQPAAPSPLGTNPIPAASGEQGSATALSASRGASRPVQAEAPTGRAATSDPADAVTPVFGLDADAATLLAQPATAAPLAATAQAPAPESQPAPAQAAVPLGAVPMTIGLRALAGSNTFEIRLDPKDLGRIEVNLAIDTETGAVQASLVVDRPETLALLQRDAGNLQQALTQAGLDAPDGSVSVSLRQDGPGGDASGGAGSQGREPGAQGQPRRPETRAQATPISVVPLRLFGAGRGLDIRI